MIENNYSRACTETLKIIDLLSVEDYKKIPESVIKIFEENKDESYVFEYDYTKNLTNQDIEDLTRGIISNLYKDYIANDNEKKEIIKIENNQLKEEEDFKRQKYNPDDLFKNKASKQQDMVIDSTKKIELIEYKEKNFIQKLFDIIINIIKRK